MGEAGVRGLQGRWGEACGVAGAIPALGADGWAEAQRADGRLGEGDAAEDAEDAGERLALEGAERCRDDGWVGLGEGAGRPEGGTCGEDGSGLEEVAARGLVAGVGDCLPPEAGFWS